MQVLNFNKGQLIAFDTLLREKTGRYVKESSLSSYSRDVCVLHSKKVGEACQTDNIIDSSNIEEVMCNVANSNICDDNMLFYDVMSQSSDINFAAHLYDKFSFVLSKNQIESKCVYIDIDYNANDKTYWDNIGKAVKQYLYFSSTTPKVIYLKRNGLVVFGDTYDSVINAIDETYNFFINNYEKELYQENVEGLLIKEELDGCEITLKEKQTLCENMLIYFDKICRLNNIKYSLTGGSLLGAVRHYGFIPWDDDADVFLSRPEYNKLVEAFSNREGRYILICNQTDKDYLFPYSRLVDTKTYVPENLDTLYSGEGMFIDVMVVDGLPNNPILRFLHIMHMRLLYRLRRSTIKGRRERLKSKDIIKYYLKVLINLFADADYWNKRIIANMDKYSFEKSKYVANLTAQYGKREILTKKGFDVYHDIEFDSSIFMVFGGYEEYLHNVYGNYWALPRENKRPDHKHETAYWHLK